MLNALCECVIQTNFSAKTFAILIILTKKRDDSML